MCLRTVQSLPRRTFAPRDWFQLAICAEYSHVRGFRTHGCLGGFGLPSPMELDAQNVCSIKLVAAAVAARFRETKEQHLELGFPTDLCSKDRVLASWLVGWLAGWLACWLAETILQALVEHIDACHVTVIHSRLSQTRDGFLHHSH